MKTISRIIMSVVCLCLLISCAKSDDELSDKTANGSQQLKSQMTTTVVWYFPSDYWAPVECNGVQVDELSGPSVINQMIAHYKDGELKWYMYHIDGTVVSQLNGEVFEIHESDKIELNEVPLCHYHFNLVGNMGTHYINHGTLNMDDWTWVVEKAVCPGN